nr:hypothetical protein [Rhodoferax sp.]
MSFVFFEEWHDVIVQSMTVITNFSRGNFFACHTRFVFFQQPPSANRKATFLRQWQVVQLLGFEFDKEIFSELQCFAAILCFCAATTDFSVFEVPHIVELRRFHFVDGQRVKASNFLDSRRDWDSRFTLDRFGLHFLHSINCIVIYIQVKSAKNSYKSTT